MRSLTRNFVALSKLFFIIRLFGSTFLQFHKLCFVVKRFIYGEKPVKYNSTFQEETLEFKAEVETLMCIAPSCENTNKDLFGQFQNYGIESNIPTGQLFMSHRSKCRSCFKDLVVENKHHVVVMYDLKLGVVLASRISKVCRKCKLYEHYGYWTSEGNKHYNDDALQQQYLLISEETAIDMDMLRDLNSLLIVGAVPFSTYASSFNRRFGLKQDSFEQHESRKVHGNLKDNGKRRNCLDRRRLEEGFLIFAVLQTIHVHHLELSHIPFDKNELAKMIIEPFHMSFLKKWGEHSCGKTGCRSVIILDGNMKNCRQVCSCKQTTQLQFEGMSGGITVGCINTPSKGSRLCNTHLETASTFRNDAHMMDDINSSTNTSTTNQENDEVLPIAVLNSKETRNGKFYEIKWNNGLTSWVRDSNLPLQIRKNLQDGYEYKQVQQLVTELGQSRKQYVKADISKPPYPLRNDQIFESHGFAIEEDEDTYVQDDAASTKRTIKCGTEKGKHKCKNAKTAGILVFEKPCGVVIDIRELFGSESKTQVYAHLHTLLSQDHMKNTEIICYDDACHLKKFAQNPLRSQDTTTAQRLSNMEIVCDRFHFKNHTDRWCRKNCNPYNSDGLKES